MRPQPDRRQPYPRSGRGMPRRAWTALALLSISLVATPAAAQHDCDAYPEDWDDIQWFRRCLDEHGLQDDRKPWMLHEAALRTENPAIVQLLVGAGADPHGVDDGGRTPLHRGAGNYNPVVTAHLLAAGADPNALDNEGYTPLHYAAASNQNSRVIARVLDAGADPLSESNDGRTPASLRTALHGCSQRDLNTHPVGRCRGLGVPRTRSSRGGWPGGYLAAGGEG